MRSAIRSAVSQSHSIASTGDGRYGWKPLLITGSALRLTLSPADLTGEIIELTEELRDALWPFFFEIQKRNDKGPVEVKLPDETVSQFALKHLAGARWGSPGSPSFWSWLNSLQAKPGDHLIFRVLDGMAKLCEVSFQARSDRDEAAIAERNRIIVQAVLNFLRKRPYGMTSWEMTVHLLSTGQYQHPIPPDPLTEVWTAKHWGPHVNKSRYGDFWEWHK